LIRSEPFADFVSELASLHLVNRSLMLVTALSPAIGYDKADFDRIVNPAVTAGPPRGNGA